MIAWLLNALLLVVLFYACFPLGVVWFFVSCAFGFCQSLDRFCED